MLLFELNLVGSNDALLNKAKDFTAFVDGNQISSAFESTITGTELAGLFRGLRDLYYLFTAAIGLIIMIIYYYYYYYFILVLDHIVSM